jgi:hypothetical protein
MAAVRGTLDRLAEEGLRLVNVALAAHAEGDTLQGDGAGLAESMRVNFQEWLGQSQGLLEMRAREALDAARARHTDAR